MPEFKPHETFAEPGGAEEHKQKGNEAFKAQDWDEAIKQYNKAISLDPNQAAFYSNRAACWSSKGNHESALADAKKCLERDPAFLKGYSRKGKALFDLKRWDEAEAAFQEGLAIDANHDGCIRGLADVKAAKSQARRPASSSGGAGGFGGGLLEKLMGKMKQGGLGGRVQMYAVVMMGYFLYNNYVKGPSSRSNDNAVGHDTDDETATRATSSGAPPGPLRRGFTEVGSSWLSYVEAGQQQADAVLLLLHRTSWSAEAEYGDTLQRLHDKATATPVPGGIRMLAPDRPCHGYSPCSQATPADWLKAIVGKRHAKQRLVVVAAGHSAVAKALAFMRKQKQAVQLLLVSPREVAPAHSGRRLGDAAGVLQWLQQQVSTAPTAQAAADAVRWAVATSSEEVEEDTEEKLDATGLPEGCEVTVLYGEGEKEDVALREELEAHGLPVLTKRAPAGGSEAKSDDLVSEVWRLATASASTESVEDD